ncbi:unnamed protein product, partial [Menidia menidia]
ELFFPGLKTAESAQNVSKTTPPEATSPPSTAPTVSSTTSSSTPSSPGPILGLLTVSWSAKCKGTVQLIPYPPLDGAPLPLCHNPGEAVLNFLERVCRGKDGCQHHERWLDSEGSQAQGYQVTEGGARLTTACRPLRVKCKERAEEGTGQLRAFKVLTALLCCVLLVILLIRFTRPTVRALQKRLSDKRQTRWIGPTQSHSVSYHRGNTTVKGGDGEKRLSYPALERLTVGDMGDPSLNRNSGYSF